MQGVVERGDDHAISRHDVVVGDRESLDSFIWHLKE